MTAVASRTLLATARYEAVMAARGRTLWWALTPLTLLSLLLASTSQQVVGSDDPVRRVAETAIVFCLLCTIGVAVGLTDRLTAHRRSGLTDLLDATAAGGLTRLIGSFLGALGVALAVPVAAFSVLVVLIAIGTGSAQALGAGLVAIAVILLPGSMVLTSFATLLGVVMPAALARAATVATWIWATVFNPTLLPVPTLTGTMFSPLGRYPAAAWLHTSPTGATYGADGLLRPAVHGGTAALGLLALLATTLALLALARIRLAARH